MCTVGVKVVWIFLILLVPMVCAETDRLVIEQDHYNIQPAYEQRRTDPRYYELVDYTYEIGTFTLKNYFQNETRFRFEFTCLDPDCENTCNISGRFCMENESLIIKTIGEKFIEGHTNQPLLFDIGVGDTLEAGTYNFRLIAYVVDHPYASDDFSLHIGSEFFNHVIYDNSATTNLLYTALLGFSLILSVLVFILAVMMKGRR